MLKFFAADVDRVAHLPAIDAYLPEVDERKLDRERDRAHEAVRSLQLAGASR